jgi:hypothetical protein
VHTVVGVRTRGLDIKVGAAKLKADRAARLEAELVVDRWGDWPRAATCSGRQRSGSRCLPRRRGLTCSAPDAGRAGRSTCAPWTVTRWLRSARWCSACDAHGFRDRRRCRRRTWKLAPLTRKRYDLTGLAHSGGLAPLSSFLEVFVAVLPVQHRDRRGGRRLSDRAGHHRFLVDGLAGNHHGHRLRDSDHNGSGGFTGLLFIRLRRGCVARGLVFGRRFGGGCGDGPPLRRLLDRGVGVAGTMITAIWWASVMMASTERIAGSASAASSTAASSTAGSRSPCARPVGRTRCRHDWGLEITGGRR